MRQLARRATETQPSATAEVFRRVAELRAQGERVVSLAVGEPDFDPPEHIRRAAQRALETGPYGYTAVAGLPALREAIGARSLARRGQVHTADEIVVCAGAKHALFNVAQVLYEPGDEVLIPTPTWVSYGEQARLCGATPVPLPCAREDGFLLRPDALSAALTARTKALVLCSPSNPTGATYAASELRELAEVLRRHETYVIVDEIYAELFYGGPCAPSLLTVAPDLRDRTILVDGVSKTYAMTGFRVGWLLAPRPIARACETIQSQVTTSIATSSQLAALAALTGDQACVATMRHAYAGRRRQLLDGLRDRCGIACAEPSGAFYLFVDVRPSLGRSDGGVDVRDDVALARVLLEQARVAVVPGTAFGAPGHLRLSYAAQPSELDEAVARLSAFLTA